MRCLHPLNSRPGSLRRWCKFSSCLCRELNRIPCSPGTESIISTEQFRHSLSNSQCTRWFKYDRDDLCVNKSQFVPVIFESICTIVTVELFVLTCMENSGPQRRIILRGGGGEGGIREGGLRMRCLCVCFATGSTVTFCEQKNTI
jgi:hypothetical protein